MLLVISLALAIPARANFHVGKADKQTIPFGNSPVLKFTDYIACPSNYMNCKCYGGYKPNSDRGVGTVSGGISGDFSLKAGLCGMGQLDFYHRADQKKWEFYVHGGDGSIQGTCYPTTDTIKGCALNTGTTLQTNYDDKLICYSYICGN